MKRKITALFIAVMMLTMCVAALAEEVNTPTELTENEGGPILQPQQEPVKEEPPQVTDDEEPQETGDEEPQATDDEEPQAPGDEEPQASGDEEPTGVPNEPTEADKINARVTVNILTSGGIRVGDWVTLEAKVRGMKDNPYELRWECDDGSGWSTVEGETGSMYTFQVTNQNIDCQWRAVLVY